MQLDNEIRVELERRFIIKGLLGKGSFGDVYQCQDKLNQSSFAVKVISKINVKKSKIDSLKEEAKLLHSLSHPNVVKIYDFVEQQSCIFIKMELAQCGTLQALIQKRKNQNLTFSDQQIANIMHHIFQSLSYIHSLSIIHRDIKPENILLQSEECLQKLKIADFGLSTKLDFHYPKSAIAKCGTMPFMAPQILCKYTYTKAVDVWSAAIIMYMLFNGGNHPLWGKHMKTDQFKIMMSTKKMTFPEINNKLAQNFIERISKIDPNDRYTAQDALKHPWLTRKFQDQIPLTMHQSFNGFSKSHQIVNIIKCLVVLQQSIKPNKKVIPIEYIEKVQKSDAKDHQLKLRKLKSLNFQKQSLMNSFNMQFSPDKNAHEMKKDFKKEEKSRKISFETDHENPTIIKLNQIFNTLFDKKVTQKTIYLEKARVPRDLMGQMPNIDAYKTRIEDEIQKAVFDFRKANKNKNKRILPTKASEFMKNENKIEEDQIDFEGYRKNKYKKKKAGSKSMT